MSEAARLAPTPPTPETPCDLCSLPVGPQPFMLHVPAQDLAFCCEGCRGIYQMLHDIADTPVQEADNAR